MKTRYLSAAALVCAAGMAHGQNWTESGDAGDTIATAQVCAGAGTLSTIAGTNLASDTDMYVIDICDEANFSATTVGGGTWDSQLWLFTSSGMGVVFCDDNVGGIAGPSTLTSTFVTANGQYLLAISRYNRDAQTASAALIWNNTPFEGERAPDGPGAASPLATWTGTTTAANAYTITLTGTCYVTTGPTGACCLSGFNCIVTSSASCATQSGTYQGDGSVCSSCPQPPTGRCCADDGTCSVLTQAACTTAAGVYGGDNTNCSPNPCVATTYNESGDAGDLPGTASVVSGSGSLTKIRGTLTTGDADMYKINVCDAASFRAQTVGNTTVDTILTMYRPDGRGVVHNDDHVVIAPEATVLQSRITSQHVAPVGNGDYYIAVVQFNKQATSGNGQLWINDNTTGHEYRAERVPDGPGAADAITGWTTTTTTGGAYAITFNGACFVSAGPACYANCDGSTATPALTANDFQCFINKYAANDPYANCDGSTAIPALTANDFQCFINKYAGGCS